MSWPAGADGDVFRRTQSSKFDFSSMHEIDFNVDFKHWPPSPEAIHWLQQEFKRVAMHPPEGSSSGYVQFTIVDKLSSELVIATQVRVTSEMSQYGGICESWGVLQLPRH